jgi:alginate O-acetyltransferase complex protein AlgJ
MSGVANPAIPAYTEPAKALLGENGWLFLCNRSTIGQLSGRLSLQERQLGEYERAFRARWERFDELGIPYVFAAAPMKELIYSEYLPEGFDLDVVTLPLDRLLGRFRGDPAVELIDLRPALRRGKQAGDVYYKTDTHFSAGGAHRAYRAIASHPFCADLDIEPLAIGKFPLAVKPLPHADLANKEVVALAGDEIASIERPVETEVAQMVDIPRLRESVEGPLEVPSGYTFSPNPVHQTRIFERRGGQDLPTAVVIGDSFMTGVLPFLLEHFRRLTWVWTPNPPFSVVEREQPDIVIHLIAERFLIRSPLMPDWELEPKRPVAFEPTLMA